MKKQIQTLAQAISKTSKSIKPFIPKILINPSFPEYSYTKGMRFISSLLTLQTITLYTVHIIATPALNQGLNRYKEATGRIALNLFGSDRSTQGMLLELQIILEWVWIGAIALTLISIWTLVFPQQFIRLAQKLRVL
jgi:hypothetical protein